MKLLIKSLAGGNFHLDAEPNDTIGIIKSKIQTEQGHAPELQKIIFSGKILTDDKTVADCNIKEKDFLVVMVSKPKAPKPAAAAAASTSNATVDKPAETSAAAETAKADAPSASSTTATTEASATESATVTSAASIETSAAASTDTPSTVEPASSGSSGSFLTGGPLEAAMSSMMEMGFEREQVQRAMRAAEQVIDLGNPAMLAQLQQLVQQNPAALQPLVQAIAQSNPQLAEAMNQDPQGVLSLLAGGAAGGAGEEMELPTLAELSEQDRSSVEQIVAMGIPEAKAIESYFMCGKNVEMAVQYYFENPQDFED
uniref:UV excision repair protein RAD23 n=1 Tax=Melanopsichium pennsylvanicum 4 TaxID=1398559 RepID=A0A077R2E8_9BASI|nr:related to RAD23-nucleotide excision repair protein (ubiquitin-like protein) [Melanopsichium pennsylvanicum 4]